MRTGAPQIRAAGRGRAGFGRWGSLLAILVAGACSHDEAALGRPPVSFPLIVRTSEPARFRILAVGRNPAEVVAGPTEARRLQLRLWSGRYVVEAEFGERVVRVPAPLLEGIAPVEGLEVEVGRPPPEDADWAWIPPGVAVIGDTLGVGQEDERPAHLERLGGFQLARTEVTNADYAAFLNSVGEVDPRWLALDSLKCLVRRATPDGPFETTAPRKPVVTVSKPGAEAYCAWLTAKTGVVHRLPRESEWEKAARGPESLVYSYGDVSSRLAANQESGELVEVARFPASGFGLFDMTGNAFEWVAEEYDGAAYARRLGLAPDPATLPKGSRSGALPYQVLRGGSFVLDGLYLRNSFRMRQRAGVRTDDIGFRVLRETGKTQEEAPDGT